MAHLPLGFRLLLLIGLSLALPLLEHEGDANDKPDSYNKDDDFQDYFRYVSELMAKAPSEPSEESDKILARWTPESGVNPEEVGGYLEGDIVSPIRSASRTGLTATSSKWPNGVIPYEIDDTFTKEDKTKIVDAIGLFNKTCAKFIPHKYEANYIKLTNKDTGCWSEVGMIGGMQYVNLQSPICLITNGTIVHELMHAAGVIHEHTREDRDKYVNITWDNIMNGREKNFDIVKPNTTDTFGVEYDYGSVMHFSRNAFSKGGKPTIVPKNNNVTIGQRVRLSEKDITKLNMMYRCELLPTTPKPIIG